MSRASSSVERSAVALTVCLVLVLTGCRSSLSEERLNKVGRTTRSWQDDTRTRWDGTGARPLPTTIWYPATADAKESRSAVGFPGATIFELGRVAIDAPISGGGGQLPLVILSHGTGGSALDLSWLAEPLAANGHLVAAVTHHGNSIAADDLAPEGFFLWWERSPDSSIAIDRLEADASFGPRLDRSRIAAADFSLGGHSVVLLGGARVDLAAYRAWCESADAVAVNCTPPPEALELAGAQMNWQAPATLAAIERAGNSYLDPRVRAVYSIAPAVANAMTPESLATMSIPVRVIVGSDDQMAPADVNAAHVARHVPQATLLPLDGVDHYAFLPACGWAGRWLLGEVCAEGGTQTRNAIHTRIARDALAFFEKSRSD